MFFAREETWYGIHAVYGNFDLIESNHADTEDDAGRIKDDMQRRYPYAYCFIVKETDYVYE